MAFRGKSVDVLRQSISGNVQSPMTSMLNSVRCISSKIFVGGITNEPFVGYYKMLIYSICAFKLGYFGNVGVGLSYGIDDQSLRDAFSGYGDVIEGEFNLNLPSYIVTLW